MTPHKRKRRARESANKALTQASRHHTHIYADIFRQQAEEAAD